MKKLEKDFAEKLATIFGYVEELSPSTGLKQIWKRSEYLMAVDLFKQEMQKAYSLGVEDGIELQEMHEKSKM
jgi:hypothetical protein